MGLAAVTRIRVFHARFYLESKKEDPVRALLLFPITSCRGTSYGTACSLVAGRRATVHVSPSQYFGVASTSCPTPLKLASPISAEAASYSSFVMVM